MWCYSCAEQGIDQPAVALCRSCNAGLCLEHLRDTAARFAAGNALEECHHDTSAVIKPIPSRPAAAAAGSAPDRGPGLAARFARTVRTLLIYGVDPTRP